MRDVVIYLINEFSCENHNRSEQCDEDRNSYWHTGVFEEEKCEDG